MVKAEKDRIGVREAEGSGRIQSALCIAVGVIAVPLANK